jgi:hypothetical protein
LTGSSKKGDAMRRIALVCGFLACGLASAATARAADTLTLSSLNPKSGMVLGVAPGLGAAGLTAGHAVLATFQYTLDSAKKAKIDVITQGVGGNTPHVGLSFPNTADAGKGTKAVRFGVQCKIGPPASTTITYIRAVMTDAMTNKVLFDKAYPVKFVFRCGGRASTEPSRTSLLRGGGPAHDQRALTYSEASFFQTTTPQKRSPSGHTGRTSAR